MGLLGGIFLFILAVFLYFLPTIIGWNKENSNGIAVVNFFLGWTLLGWVVALVWAISSTTTPTYWNYTCPRCGFVGKLDQKVRLYSCPQCKTETPFDVK